MRRLTVLAVILLVLGMTEGCGGSESSDSLNIPKRLVTVRADPPGSPRTLKPLTEQQRAETRRIIARDVRFRRIVGGDFSLTRSIPWGTQDNRGTQPREVLIGTRSEAVLDKAKPLLVTTWPLWDDTAGETPAYYEFPAHLRVRGLRSVAVYVDLKRHKIAAITPVQADEVKFPSGWPTAVEPD